MTKLTKEMVRKAVENSGGVYSVIAQKCGVGRSTMSMFLHNEKNKDLLIEINQEKEKALDMAENKLMKLIEDGEFQAIKFFLGTQGKSRGYVEKSEINANLSPGYKVEITYPNGKYNKVESEPKTS